jgi:hypothetical protein
MSITSTLKEQALTIINAATNLGDISYLVKSLNDNGELTEDILSAVSTKVDALSTTANAKEVAYLLKALEDNSTTSTVKPDMGTAGTFGYGQSPVPDEYLPAGYVRLTGHTDATHKNYGTVMDERGSEFVYIAPFYYKVDVNAVTTVNEPTAGYVALRAFKDSPNGFLFSKFMLSILAGKLVSKQFGRPVSTNSANAPISGAGGGVANNYAGFLDACNHAGYRTPSIFEWIALQILVTAHAQASGSNIAICAYNDVAPNLPKGCNNNALADVNDTSVKFISSGYSNQALAGSATNYAKTTHNGQECGIADMNGNMYKIVTGLTYLAKTGATCANGATTVAMPAHGLAVGDVIYFGGTPSSGQTYNTGAFTVATVVDANNFTLTAGVSREILATDGVYSAKYFRILKESVHPDSLNSTNVLNESLYDMLDLTGIIGSNNLTILFGNGANQVLNFSTNTSSNEYKKAMCGIPTSTGVSSGGTTAFGNDFLYRYLRHGLVPIVGADWDSAAGAGVFALLVSGWSLTSSGYVGGFASVSLKRER